MKLTVKKWGNSYAIRIPKELASSFKLKEDTVLYASKEDDKVILRRLTKLEILEEIMKGAKRQEETDWGAPRGKELW